MATELSAQDSGAEVHDARRRCFLADAIAAAPVADPVANLGAFGFAKGKG